MDDRIRGLQTYPMIELARRRAALEADGVRVLDFGTGDPREPTAAHIRQALIDAVPEVSQYPSIKGTPEVRSAYVGYVERRFGVRLDPETEVIPSRGSKEAIFHVPLVTVEVGGARDTVVYPEPGYPVMEIGTLYSTARRHPVALDASNAYRMHPDAIPPEVLDRTALVWINYPHNPTGQDLPEETWRAWVAARERHGFILCSDECYTEIFFDTPPRSLLEFGREGCLVFHSLSKRSGMTGYRSGMVSGDATLLARYRAQRAGFGQANPAFIEAAAAAAWSDDTHVAERVAVFGQKRALLLEGLGALGLEVYPTTSTFYMWVRAPEGESGTTYADRLLEHGILVSPGAFFGAGNEGFFRLALVPTVAGCEEALERWAAL